MPVLKPEDSGFSGAVEAGLATWPDEAELTNWPHEPGLTNLGLYRGMHGGARARGRAFVEPSMEPSLNPNHRTIRIKGDYYVEESYA